MTIWLLVDDETEVMLEDFIEANWLGLWTAEIEEIRELAVGSSTTIGGGAFATTRIKRIA